MESQVHHHEVLRVLRYVFPTITLAYFVIAQILSLFIGRSTQDRSLHITRKPLVLLQFGVLILYTIEALLLIINDLVGYGIYSSMDGNFQVLLEVLIWMLLSATLLESNDNLTWYPLYGSWALCLTLDIILFGFEVSARTPFKYLRICFQIVRLTMISLLLLLYYHRHTFLPQEKDEESTALLHPPEDPATKALSNVLTYGSVETEARKDPQDAGAEAEHSKARSGDWIQYFKGFSVFVPLLWPTKQLRAQLSIFGVIACLVVGRVLNLLLPRQFGTLVDSFSQVSIDFAVFPGLQLGLFLLYRFLTSYKVIIEVESTLWLPFGNFTVRNIKSAAHLRVMALSRDVQDSKGAEEMIKIVEHGTTVVWLLRNFSMFLLPCVLDVLIFGVYLSCVFGIYMALLLSITLVLYIWVSRTFAARRIAPQKTVLDISKKEDQVLYQSISEWETVSRFNAQAYENEQVSKITERRLLSESALQWFVAQGNLCSEFVLHLGFAIAFALAIFQIVHGTQSVGSFAMMAFYIVNISSDIHSVAVLGSSLLEDLAEVETLRDLFLAEPSVRDGTAEFRPYEGAVLFSGVSFGYDDKTPVLQDFNFSAKAGQRISLVGETGAGKTTLLRLLMRFYDIQAGKIMIDGQDIRNVILSSLRSAVGIIPSNPTLFDNTILENVRYARLGASDQEIFEACKEVGIHDRILSYADGYSTRVGEGGVELSDGEKQQIAIARVVLKNPRIVLLDEAPDFVDSLTEARIQKALQRLTSGKTTFAIAHRLSTIQNSDTVLVMKEGNIVEQGSPFELLEASGEFAKIWKDQFAKGPAENVDLSPQESPVADQHVKPSLDRHVKDRSESSFRPDAPEFVPHFQRSTESSSQTHPHLGPGHQHESRDIASHAQSHRAGKDKRPRSPTKRMQYKPYKKNANQARRLETSTETLTANSREDTPTSQFDGAGQKLPDVKTTPRLSRGQRRRQARSDPNSSTLSSDQVDTTVPRNADGKGQSVISRRVSGPGKYPSESTKPRVLDVNVKETQKGANQQTRRKRHQQSRLRKSEQSTSEDATQTNKMQVAPRTEVSVGPEPENHLQISNDKENKILGGEQIYSTRSPGPISAGNVSSAQAS